MASRVVARRKPIAVPLLDLAAHLRRHDTEQAAYAEAVAGLADELDDAGLAVARLSDVVAHEHGARSLPILLTWLPRVDNVDVKIDIVAALAAPWARPAALRPLVDEYRNSQGSDLGTRRLRAAICTTLERVADETIAEDLVEIATASERGAERGMAIVALGNLVASRRRAVELLTALLDDDSVALFAVLGLTKLGASEAIDDVRALRSRHLNPIVRDAALRAIRGWVQRSTPPPLTWPPPSPLTGDIRP